MPVRFGKYEGLGNDFIILESEGPGQVAADWVRRICDRHRGVGADGVLVVGVRRGHPFMRVINADGSAAQMCGNGIRCVALHLANGLGSRSGSTGVTLTIETDAGPHTCQVHQERTAENSAQEAVVEVEMAVPTLEPDAVPLRSPAPWIDAPVEVGGRTLHVTAVSMGNPHLVSFDPVGDARHGLGPLLASDGRLPESANVGFATPLDEGRFELAVLERGAGWTQACGTGACAAAVAAVATGRAQPKRWIDMRLPGGSLQIRVGEPGEPVCMQGPARHVFDGTWLADPPWA
jgi:diaminopimelate epimerase